MSILNFMISPEFITWIVITILFVKYNKIKEKFFAKNTVIKDANNKIKELKKVKYKSIDEQKDYLRAKNDSGKDFINVVVSMLLFIIFFRYIFIPRMPNIYIGLGTVIIVSMVVALINSSMYSKPQQQYQFITSFIGFIYSGTLFLYIYFIEVLYPIILIICMILILIFMESLWGKIKKILYVED